MFFFDNQEASITVCNIEAEVIYQNLKSQTTFGNVVGKSLFECHPAHATDKIKKMLIDGIPNAYTISKKGIKKIIYQTPYYDSNNKILGLVEYSMIIPADMPHYNRG